MAEETHLFVIWQKGRFAAARILEDIRKSFDIVHICEVHFPGKAVECYCQFYNTRCFNVRKKVSRCGNGPFLVVIVRVKDVRHVVDQYGKRVNALMYRKKSLYRQWCGGKYRVHGTLEQLEYNRDVYLLTGHTAEEWGNGVPSEIHMELPPFDSLPPPPRRESVLFRMLRHLGFAKKKELI